MGMLDIFINHCNDELQDWNSVSLVGGEHYSSILINWMSHGITTWIYPYRVPFTKSRDHLAGRTTGTCSTIANYSARAKKKRLPPHGSFDGSKKYGREEKGRSGVQ